MCHGNMLLVILTVEKLLESFMSTKHKKLSKALNHIEQIINYIWFFMKKNYKKPN